VLGAKNHSHGAAAQLFDDFIAAANDVTGFESAYFAIHDVATTGSGFVISCGARSWSVL
jgi:hypothetical protein